MKNLSGGKVIIKYVIVYLLKSFKQPVVWRFSYGFIQFHMCHTVSMATISVQMLHYVVALYVANVL
jgi:hypothetical protein